MYATSIPVLNLQQRSAELADLIGSLLFDVRTVLARSDQHAEPTPDDWTALEIQMNALAELQHARDALARAISAPPVGIAAAVDLPKQPVRTAPCSAGSRERLLIAA